MCKSISDKGLKCRILKALTKLNNKKMKDLAEQWAKDQNRPFTKECIQSAHKHMKKILSIICY